jgi:hypothetical protein
MRDSTEALIMLEGSATESQNHKLALYYIIHQSPKAYLSPKTTRGQDGDSG